MKSTSNTSAVTGRVGVLFLLVGVLSFVYATYSTSSVLALVGLGLTFWGVLFLIVSPARYVEGGLLVSTAMSSYVTIDRIIKDLKYVGKCYYIPPYPKEAYLPEYLKGLKDTIVFVSAENVDEIPSIEVIAKGDFVVEKPDGVLLGPPGVGLLARIEKELKMDSTKIKLDKLCEVLPHLFLENLSLVKSMEMTLQEDEVYLRLEGSLYKSLFDKENDLKSVTLLGCPIVSAVACAIAKASGKTVTIQELNVSPETQSTDVTFRIIRAENK